MRLFICTLFYICCFGVLVAQAETLQDLPDVQNMDIQTFVANSNEIAKTYDEDKFLAFEVQLPKNFTERGADRLKTYVKQGRLYGEVYRADGETVQDVRPYFNVQIHELNRMISAKNWFVANILKFGHTLRALKSDKKGNNFEAMYIRFDSLGNTEIVRSKGYLKGPRIIVAEYVVPVLLWENQRDIQIFTVKSFELKGAADTEQVEKLLAYSYLESFSMQYPASWRMEKEVKELENQIDLSFLTADDLRTIFANIDVTIVSDQSLKDPIDRSRYPTNLPFLVQARKDAVQAKDFLVDDVMERRTYDLAVQNAFQITEIYPLRRKLTDYVTHRKAPVTQEFWITVIKGTKDVGKNYIISMLAPSRNEDAYNWALAAKAYEAIVESIR